MVKLMNLSVFFACITFIYTGDDLWFKTNHFDIPFINCILKGSASFICINHQEIIRL